MLCWRSGLARGHPRQLASCFWALGTWYVALQEAAPHLSSDALASQFLGLKHGDCVAVQQKHTFEGDMDDSVSTSTRCMTSTTGTSEPGLPAVVPARALQ